MRPAPREIDEGEEAHMARLPGCTEECVDTRTWHKRAVNYWRVFGDKFDQEDQERYCKLVEDIGFVAASHTVFSRHPITKRAASEPSWPALILLQLWFKPWAKFKHTTVGRALSSGFPNADLEFPLPNGGDYPPAPRKTVATRKNVQKQWEGIMALRSQTRMVFSESPRRETPVPLPRNVQYPGTTPITVDTPSPSSSTDISRPSSPVGPHGRHHSSPASSVAVILPRSRIKTSPTGARSLRSRTEDSSLFVRTPGYVPSPLSRPPITLEDDTAVAPSPVDSDDLPLVRRIHKPQRTSESSTTRRKDPTTQHREIYDHLKPVTTNQKYRTTQGRRARRSETPSDDDYDFVPNSVEHEVDFSQSPPVSTRTPAFTRGRKRMRSENTTSSETPRTQYTRSLKKRLKSLEKRLPRLEGAQAILEEELKKLKNGSKEQKLAIAELRKEKDSIAIEVRIREELERRGD